MTLELKGSFLALMDITIYSFRPFYITANSMVTSHPYHWPHQCPISESGSRERKGWKWWFGLCLWFPLLLPFPVPHPPGPWFPWLTDNRTKLLSSHLCVSHVMLQAPPQLWWIIWDRVTGADGHSAPWLCHASASAESIACPGWAGRMYTRLCWDLPSFLEACRDQGCMGGPV